MCVVVARTCALVAATSGKHSIESNLHLASIALFGNWKRCMPWSFIFNPASVLNVE
jgi:hypothetical protein